MTQHTYSTHNLPPTGRIPEARGPIFAFIFSLPFYGVIALAVHLLK